jgi:hypothetical protein
LLDVAERDGFAVFVTTDSKLKFQQNLSSRRIAIVALLTTSWPRIERAVVEVVKAIMRKTANPRFDPTRSGGLRPPTRSAQPNLYGLLRFYKAK